jgi:hypothetical protein
LREDLYASPAKVLAHKPLALNGAQSKSSCRFGYHLSGMLSDHW